MDQAGCISQKYHIALSASNHRELEAFIWNDESSACTQTRARIPSLSDESQRPSTNTKNYFGIAQMPWFPTYTYSALLSVIASTV